MYRRDRRLAGRGARRWLSLGDVQLAAGLPDARQAQLGAGARVLAGIPGADTGAASGRLAQLPPRTGLARRGPARLTGRPASLQRSRRSRIRPNDAVKLRSGVSYVSSGRGANAGHAQPRLAAGEHSPGRDGSTDEGRLSSATMSRALGEDELIEALQGISLLGIRSQTHVTERVLAGRTDLLAVGAFCIGTNQVDLAAAAKRGVAGVQRAVLQHPLRRRAGDRRDHLARPAAAGEERRRCTRASGTSPPRARTRSAAASSASSATGTSAPSCRSSPSPSACPCTSTTSPTSSRSATRAAAPRLQELLESVETVTLHVDGRPGNHGFFGEEEFARMKPRSLFLNLSRGFVVDHAALRRHIESGHIAGAAIDVFPQRAQGQRRGVRLRAARPRRTSSSPRTSAAPPRRRSRTSASSSPASWSTSPRAAPPRCRSTCRRVALPAVPGTHRLVHLHKNVPGVLASINRVLADHGVNVEGQLLRTRDELGYVITDIGTQLQRRGARRAPRHGRHHPPAHHRIRIARPGAPYSSARRLRSALGRCLRLSRTYAWFPRREILRRMAGQPALI